MPALSNLVDLINNNIQIGLPVYATGSTPSNYKVGNFTTARFQGGLYYNIGDNVKTNNGDTTYEEPMIINNNGEGYSVSYDDIYPFQIFHMIEDIKYDISPNDYGRPGSTMLETAEMRLIFSGSRLRLNARPEDIVAVLIYNFPKEFNPTQLSSLNIESCVIEVGQVEQDMYKIWDNYWRNVSYKLDLNTILFEVKYKLTSEYGQCFSLC